MQISVSLPLNNAFSKREVWRPFDRTELATIFHEHSQVVFQSLDKI
jgi:hypothetical protein